MLQQQFIALANSTIRRIDNALAVLKHNRSVVAKHTAFTQKPISPSEAARLYTWWRVSRLTSVSQITNRPMKERVLQIIKTDIDVLQSDRASAKACITTMRRALKRGDWCTADQVEGDLQDIIESLSACSLASKRLIKKTRKA